MVLRFVLVINRRWVDLLRASLEHALPLMLMPCWCALVSFACGQTPTADNPFGLPEPEDAQRPGSVVLLGGEPPVSRGNPARIRSLGWRP